MFHTIITTAYIIPNIYVFIRIMQLFIKQGYRVYYTLIYILFASVYPLSNLLHEGDAGLIGGMLLTISDYILPYYLYLFLTVLCFDLFLLFNYFFKIFTPDKLKRKRFRHTTLIVIIFLPITVVVCGVINFNTIRTSEYNIEIPSPASKISHLKIAFVADFHLHENTNLKFVEKFVNNIKKINPDIMIYGGDIIEGDNRNENLATIENNLKQIQTKYGVYAVLGNHEYYAQQDKGSFFDKAGMVVLCDTVIPVDSSFFIAGRYDSHFRGRKKIGELIQGGSDLLPFILIDHRPTEISLVSKTLVDIQLSGHTHNGQLFPINFITGSVYDLSWGYKKIGNTHFFVTSGLRLWGPPVRTTGKSEIMVIDVSFTK